jgi:F0F1-type ATP synthase assembly protein I
MDGGKQPPMAPWAFAATAGSSLVGPVILGVLLDVQYNWMPWGTLAGLGVGIFSCLSILVMAAKRSSESPGEPPDQPGGK